MFKQLSAILLPAALVACVGADEASTEQAIGAPEVGQASAHAVSGPVRDMLTQTGGPAREPHDKPFRLIPAPGGEQPDGALQGAPGPELLTNSATNFAGIGNGDYGFSPDAAPPDTNGAVGDTQYVQWVNESFAVFDKTTGALVKGPVRGNTLFANLGGACATNNDGDPIAQYDKAAHRWVLTQFSVSSTPYTQCVAVSTTADATGSYNLYSFSYANQFNDYPKLGVWPDGYYISFNIFNNGSTFAGSKVCAYDRDAMLVGGVATQICFQVSSSYGGLLPSDLDGSNPPPAGSPNIVVNFGTNSLNVWKFHSDFANPGASTFTGPLNVPVAAFTVPCSGGGACIPQPNTRQALDSLGDRLMYRLAYRNFADGHESLVVNHSVKGAGNRHSSTTGIRWYELRNPSGGTMASGTPVVYQQGTYSPDSTSRWMASAAMDKVGNIAMGYSASSSTVFPSIYYTGRVPTDALGTMENEILIISGGGSQSGSKLDRWGDYSSMSVDPVDDCTFYYTTEYLKTTGAFNWSTRIASFKMPGCQ